MASNITKVIIAFLKAAHLEQVYSTKKQENEIENTEEFVTACRWETL